MSEQRNYIKEVLESEFAAQKISARELARRLNIDHTRVSRYFTPAAAPNAVENALIEYFGLKLCKVYEPEKNKEKRKFAQKQLSENTEK
jgi:ribosome-binding protein aMBF1 (putative translation factor)